MYQPVLTIGMPISRSDFMVKRAFLSALLPVLECENIELVICDNDPAADRSFMQSWFCDRIRYLPNDKDLGAVRNFERVFMSAKGKYVLLLGDDDYLHPSFIEVYQSDYLLALGDNIDVVASAPLYFDTPGILCSDPIVPWDGGRLAGDSPVERMQFYSEWMRGKPGNPLFYSIFRRDIADFRFFLEFAKKCPGYTSFIDVPYVEGLVMAHPIRLLSRSYNVYNLANWSPTSSWQLREVTRYRKYLKPSISAGMTDLQVFQVRQLNKAVLAIAYFIGLGNFSIHSNNFCGESYFEAVCLCLHLRYFPTGISGFDLRQVRPDPKTLSLLLEILFKRLTFYLEDSNALGGFIKEAIEDACSIGRSPAP